LSQVGFGMGDCLWACKPPGYVACLVLFLSVFWHRPLVRCEEAHPVQKPVPLSPKIKDIFKITERTCQNGGMFWLCYWDFLPAWRYASTGTSYGPASLSVTSRCSIETDGWIELIFWHAGFFWPVLHCVVRKFRCLQKQGYSGTLSRTSDLENFGTAYWSSKRVIDLAQERWTLRAW